MIRRAVPALALALLLGTASRAAASDGLDARPAVAAEDDSDQASFAAEPDLDPSAGPPGAVREPAAARPCPVRDPENGSCFPSADAADLAWLGRTAGRPAAALEEDDEEEGLEAPDPPSFWRSVGERLRSLVVRRSDSKPVAVPEEEIEALFSTTFPIPIEAYDLAKLRDTFLAKRGKVKKHHAIDLGAARGTPVVAVADGVVERLGRDRRGGKVVYLKDVTGRFTFYYAHLRYHEKGLKAGDRVAKGQRLGEVGATGRVIGGPHLHFAIYRNEAETGSRLFAVNPYLIFSTLLPR
jgi:murein DD-endopeptidase MepM/ murein hydrolase activator NlpD